MPSGSRFLGREIFHFLYRKRTWSSSQKCYLGWERKRGLICEVNKFLVEDINDFRVNTISKELIPDIKYVITLDADTNLVLETAHELIGAMSHILNEPKVDEIRNVVVEGHGIIAPRVGIDLVSSRKSLFTKIYGEIGGTDPYTNAISDIYQDNFDEGSFCGKGIYDLKVFHKVLYKEIPENTVLSHDLLEGNYLRCGLASDILLLDGHPSKYTSFSDRLARWTRGDWQIYKWLKSPLNLISKFKILDNLRRSLLPLSIFLALISPLFLNIGTWLMVVIAVVSYTIPTILNILNYVIFKKDMESNTISAYRNMTPKIGEIKRSIIRSFLELILLPYKTYITVIAIIKTIYRMNISKQNLLEWQTAEEAEKSNKQDLKGVYRKLFFNPLVRNSFYYI